MEPRIVVIGGSIAGLSVALLLARKGRHVTVLEKDPTLAPVTAGSAGEWRRTASPQAVQSHAFLAGAWRVLHHELPDVLSELQRAGVRETALLPPADASGRDQLLRTAVDDLVVLNARRSTFEWALGRVAGEEPGIDLRTGVGATGIVVEDGRIAGVTSDAGTIGADVVVDAGGTRSPVRGWVAADAPVDRDVACGISYLTRFYQLRGADPGALNRGFAHGASFDRYSCLVLPGDAGHFSVTFGILPEDHELRTVLDGPAFDAAASAIPAIAPWVSTDVSTATSGVAFVGSLRNLLRRRVDGAPEGLHAIGDARCTTNPAHARGATLAVLTARFLAGVIDRYPAEPDVQAELLDRFTDQELAVWIEDSVGQDADRLRRWRPGVEPEEPLWRHTLRTGQAALASQRDAEAWVGFSRLENMLARPADVLDDIQLVLAHRRVEVSGWRPQEPEAPEHDELVDIARRRLAAA
jgi:flavin-dependent dehydrogenase